MDITHTHCLKITDDAKREECFKGAMDAVNIPIADVQNCVRDSYSDPGNEDSYNQLLGVDRLHANEFGIKMSPSFTMNGHKYEGELRAKPIFE